MERRERRRNQDCGMPKRDYATKQTDQHDARLKEPTRHLIRGCRGKERFATPAPAGPSMIYLVTPRPILIPSRSPHLAHAQVSMSKRKAPTPQTIFLFFWGTSFAAKCARAHFASKWSRPSHRPPQGRLLRACTIYALGGEWRARR